MMTRSSVVRQRGVATIFVAMIMLIFITLMVATAYNLSTVQIRDEAIAAAQKAIELAISGTFWNPAIEQNFDIDINNDTVNDYQVRIAVPTCQRATKAILTTTSSVTLPGFSSAAAWNTVWVLDATATEDISGTRVRVRHGVRVLMSNADKNLYCG